MHIVLTGFNPFGSNAVNPSQIIVEALAARTYSAFTLTAEVLPTEYAAAGARVGELIHTLKPDAVVMLGLAGGRGVISLERVAINLNDAGLPDNAGDFAQGRLIAPDGPAAYWSTLPLDALHSALHQRQLPVGYSNHAGAFVCNHVFYSARHASEQAGLSIPCGFIHVPPLADSADSVANAVPLEVLLDGIETCLHILAGAQP